MRGGALPPALLCAGLAFALAFAPRGTAWPALVLLAVSAVTLSLLRWHIISPEIIFAGCWISVAATAALVHLPGGVRTPLALALAGNAGLWAAGVVAISGTLTDLASALSAALLVLPAAWLVAHRGAIAVKVVSSWLVAVAILAATLPIVPTPGYAPDHME